MDKKKVSNRPMDSKPALVLLSTNISNIPEVTKINGSTFTIGSDPCASLVIAHENIARFHCIIEHILTNKWTLCFQRPQSNKRLFLKCGDKIGLQSLVCFRFLCSPDKNMQCCFHVKKSKFEEIRVYKNENNYEGNSSSNEAVKLRVLAPQIEKENDRISVLYNDTEVMPIMDEINKMENVRDGQADKGELDHMLDALRKKEDDLEIEFASLEEQLSTSMFVVVKLKKKLIHAEEECWVTQNNAKSALDDLEYKCKHREDAVRLTRLELQDRCHLDSKKKLLRTVLFETQQHLAELDQHNWEIKQFLDAKTLRIQENIAELEEKLEELTNIKAIISDIMNREFQCCICSDLFVDTTVTICNHFFCSDCLKSWIRNQENCPLCRQKLDAKDFIKMPSIDETLNNLTKLIYDDHPQNEKLKRINEIKGILHEAKY